MSGDEKIRMMVLGLSLALSGCWVDHLVPCSHACPEDGGGVQGGGAGGGNGSGSGSGTATDAGTANLIFVTPGTYQVGSIADADGGLSVADTICNSVARDLGHSGRFIALLSTSKMDMKDRIPAGIHGWASKYGDPVFDLPGSPQMRGRIGFVGSPVAGGAPTWVATGSTNWGTFAGSNCEDWTSADAGSTYVAGDATALVSGWANASVIGCDQLSPLYCAQVDHSDGIPLVPPPGSLRVFVTEQTYASGGGRSRFDRACEEEALAAGLSGNFKAFLSTQSVQATQAQNWGKGERYRMDGARTTDPETASYELFNPLFLVPIQVTATGRTLVSLQFQWPASPLVIPTDTAVWFGAGPSTPMGATACNDWFSTGGTGLAADATSLQGNHWNQELLVPGGTRDCNQPAHVFCVEVP